jgi:hypothetical protein
MKNRPRLSLQLSFLVAILCLAARGGAASNTNTLTTPSFRVIYEKNVPEKAARHAGAVLESTYVEYHNRLGMALRHRLDVNLYKSGHRLMEASDNELFNDAVWKDKVIYLAADLKDDQLRNAAARVVSRAILADRVECPSWLAEAYSLNAGGDLHRFGRLSNANMTSFTDLAEDYLRAEGTKEKKEVFAKLSATIAFLVGRYGDARVDALFDHFKSGVNPDSAIQSHFGEKLETIEEEWAKELASQPGQPGQ